jgi:PAS domain S-box-containing protein
MLSELAVPVVVDDRTAAVLNVESSKPNAITDSDQRLLEILTTHVASAIRGMKDEEALANERNVLRTLIDTLPDNIFIKDAESRFMISNLAHARLLRAKTPDEIVGKTDFDIFPRELAVSYYADEQAVIRSGQPLFNREERTIDPEGKTRWLLTTKVPLRDDQGKAIGIVGINRDITERKRAEEALANERNVLRTLIDTLPDNIFIKDAESRFVISNLAHARLLRAKTPDEIVGKTDYDIFPHELAASYYADEQVVIRSGQPLLNREERTIDPEGKTRWLLTTKVPLRDDHGKVIGIAGINRDITERKRMEEALANERNVLRTLIDTLPDNIFIKDAESRFVTTNLVHVHHLRAKTLDEIVGKTDFDLYPRELAASYYADEQAVIRSGQPLVNREERTIDPGGKTRWLLTTKVPLRDDQGKIIGIVGVNRDITERKQMEEELRESEERFRGIAERSLDVIFTTDREGRITYISPAVERVLGYKPEEVVGQPIQNYLPESEIPKAFQALSDTLQGRVPKYLEFEVRRKDGSLASTWISASSTVRDGAVIGAQAILRDITQRKLMEEAIRTDSDHLKEQTSSERASRNGRSSE